MRNIDRTRTRAPRGAYLPVVVVSALAAGCSSEGALPIDARATDGAIDRGGARDRSVEGSGGDAGCTLAPKPTIVVSPAKSVAPQTKLTIDGSRSSAASGSSVVRYIWSVAQPKGSSSQPQPSAGPKVASFSLEANVAGTYTFSLDVVDDRGRNSCTRATAAVTAVAGGDVRVQLVWDTPGDPNQSDTGPGAGTDLDIHLVHPSAKGSGTIDADGDKTLEGWFAKRWDCFSYQMKPDWGPGTKADPRLDRDDTDGAGPETISAGALATGVYAIGVHVSDDHGFGTSTATVKVYHRNKLALTIKSPPLSQHQLWFAARLSLPAGTASAVTNASGKPAIATATWTPPAP